MEEVRLINLLNNINMEGEKLPHDYIYTLSEYDHTILHSTNFLTIKHNLSYISIDIIAHAIFWRFSLLAAHTYTQFNEDHIKELGYNSINSPIISFTSNSLIEVHFNYTKLDYNLLNNDNYRQNFKQTHEKKLPINIV